MTVPPGTKCATCLHPFASHHEGGCAHNVQCPCLGFELLEPGDDIGQMKALITDMKELDHCCGGCDCNDEHQNTPNY